MNCCATKFKEAAAERLPALLVCFVFAVHSLLAGEAEPSKPGRFVAAYALTSAHNEEGQDPRAWRLLGSNDGERSWTVLDVQTNQVFAARCQRRVYAIRNRTAYNIYRLQVEAEAAPLGTHLAELELMGKPTGVASEAGLHTIITASKEHALMGPAAYAFDNDPTTKWRDYGAGQSTGCWIQCQYTSDPEVLVTNASQVLLLARLAATRSSLSDRVPQILSNLNAQATTAVRSLTGYALTSANDSPERDPRDWRLLGSNDRGKTWETLDVRRNEVFSTRFQKRVFALTNHAACAIYRLQIDSVRVPGSRPPDGLPDGVTSGANSVQLAEIEPSYGPKNADAQLSVVVSVQGENPPVESADMLFDGNPRTKWLDYSRANTNRPSWVQWQYISGEKAPIINLHRLRAARLQSPRPLKLQLEGVVVSWNVDAKTLGFLDETGFQIFELSSTAQVRPGDRIRLGGRLQFGQELPVVLQPELVSLGSLPAVPEIRAERPFDEGQHFLSSAAEGRVMSISDDPFYMTIQLTTEEGSGRLLARILNPQHARLPSFTGCRLRVTGVVQPVFNEAGKQIAGVIWVPSLDCVALALPTEQEWKKWPEYSVESLVETNSSATLGHPVRVRGTVVERTPEKILAHSQGTNQFIIYSQDAVPLVPGASVEAIGILGKEGRTPVLHLARYRSATEQNSVSQESIAMDKASPVTQIRQIHSLAKNRPGAVFPVRVRGVITYLDLGLDDFYLQDGPDSIIVRNQLSAGLCPFLKQEGMYVELDGSTDGRNPPAVVPGTFVTVLGKGRMPEPRRHSRDYLMTGKDDTRWVEIEGVVREVEEHRMVLVVTGGQVTVLINETDKRSQNRLLGSRVRVCGVCSPVLNDRDQRLGIRLLVPSVEQIEVVNAAPEDPFAMATVPIHQIMRSDWGGGGLSIQFVKTAGVVTYKEPRSMFVQDGPAGLRVFPRNDSAVEPGDHVEVIGLAEPDGFSPKLVQALVRKVGRESPPSAKVIDLLGTDLNNQDATRGEIKATFLGHVSKESLQVLELQDDQRKQTFYAYFTTNNGVLPPIPAGSRVRLQGVFKAETETEPELGQVITSFAMYLNSPIDVTILKRPGWWTARHTLWILGGSGAVLFVSLGWASSLRRQVRQRTRQLGKEIDEHKRTETNLEAEIAERKRMEIQVQKAHQELLDISRQAGMAEVATSVLHNVGNVLNSVNVGSSCLADSLRKSKAANLSKVVALLGEHEEDLGNFITNDPKGKQLPAYLAHLADHLAGERAAALEELAQLQKNIEHIKDIVTMQQSFAKVSGATEKVEAADLMEDTLRLNAHSLARHDIQVIREFASVPPLSVEKHKVLQILVNLVGNARHACAESSRADKRLTLSIASGDGSIKMSVTDNGIGISAENRTRIFAHGFTTKRDGHGFGLHSGALAAKEMRGSLSVHSEGPGKGATFTLELPLGLPIREAKPRPPEARLDA
jgi:signal transduction histidine kinase